MRGGGGLGVLLAVLTMGGPGAGGQAVQGAAAGQKAAFEVATVRALLAPGSRGEDWDSAGDRVEIRGYTLRRLIRAAFDLRSDAQVVGGPAWIGERRFDISAKLGGEGGGEKDVGAMLQALLRERFKLRVNSAQQMLPAFSLVVGAELKGVHPDATAESGLRMHDGQLEAVATSMSELAAGLARMPEVGDRPVVDETGLPGRYDFRLRWAPERKGEVPADAVSPGLFTALREQLGLRLKAEKRPVPVIEVVGAELPVAD